jgi:hypothetical protein
MNTRLSLMLMLSLIGLGGYATSGKDVVADLLVKEFGYHKTFMSAPLEAALIALNPIIFPSSKLRYAEFHRSAGYEETKKNVEVRTLLQKLGTEVGRKLIHEDVWVEVVFRDILTWLNEGKKVVVTGIRYPNELVALRALNGTAVWVDRGRAPVNSHSSDNALGINDFDESLLNKTSLTAFKKVIRAWVTG